MRFHKPGGQLLHRIVRRNGIPKPERISPHRHIAVYAFFADIDEFKIRRPERHRNRPGIGNRIFGRLRIVGRIEGSASGLPVDGYHHGLRINAAV